MAICLRCKEIWVGDPLFKTCPDCRISCRQDAGGCSQFKMREKDPFRDDTDPEDIEDYGAIGLRAWEDADQGVADELVIDHETKI